MSSPFESVHLPPLEEGESALAVAEASERDTDNNDVGVCVTDHRILVFREQPNHMDEEQRVHIRQDIPLAAVQRMKARIGPVTEDIRLKTAGGNVYELPELYVETQHVRDTIIEAVGLVDREELKRQREQETWLGRIKSYLPYVTASSGLIGIWLGVISVLVGMVLSFSFFGILVGVPFYFLGVALMVWGIEALIGEERNQDDTEEREWVLPAYRSATG